MNKKLRNSIFWFLSLAGVAAGSPARAQTTLLSEDFEVGSGAFTVVNGTQVNQWVVGSVAGNGPTRPGSRAAFVSGDAGATHSYQLTTYATVHLYLDVTFPAGQNEFDLSFDWYGVGQGGSFPADYLSVALAPPSYVPTAGRTVTGTGVTVLTETLHTQPAYGRTTLRLPQGDQLGGTTRRLVFTWRNDNARGQQPPAALDNLTLVGTTLAPLSGTYTVNRQLPSQGRNFATLAEAIYRLNVAGTSAPTLFRLWPAQTFPEPLPPITRGGTPAAPVTFASAAPRDTNPVISATSGVAVDIDGADNLTFDHIDVRTTVGVAAAFAVSNRTTTDGARNVTIQNATITMSGGTGVSGIGVRQRGDNFSVDTAGVNRNIRYENLIIQNASTGVDIQGGSAAFPDERITVAHVAVNGPGTPLGAVPSGILVENVKQLLFHHNSVRNYASTSSTVIGIDLRNLTGFGPEACHIYNNAVSGLRYVSTSTNLAPPYIWGFVLGQDASEPASEWHVYNNEVRDLSLDYTGVPRNSRHIVGLYTLLSPALAGNRFHLHHNTVVVAGGTGYVSAAYEFLGSTTALADLRLRNNIFVNTTPPQTGVAKHYAALFGQYTPLTAAASISDYNDLYVTGANGFVARQGNTESATLADWRSATGQDAHSVSLDPQFSSAALLRPTAPALDNLATPLGVAQDLNDQNRSLSAPDLGAHEFGVIALKARAAQAATALQTWPVPFAGQLTVALPAGQPGPGQVQLLDAAGRVIRQRALTLSGRAEQLQWEGLPALPAGLYLLQLTTATGQRYTARVLR